MGRRKFGADRPSQSRSSKTGRNWPVIIREKEAFTLVLSFLFGRGLGVNNGTKYKVPSFMKD